MSYNNVSATYDKEFRITGRINKGSNNYVILEYAGEDKVAEVDLSANRYTEYFIITRDYVDQVEKVLARDQYKVDFGVDNSKTTVRDKDSKEHTIPAQLVYTDGRTYSNNLQSNTIEAMVRNILIHPLMLIMQQYSVVLHRLCIILGLQKLMHIIRQ